MQRGNDTDTDTHTHNHVPIHEGAPPVPTRPKNSNVQFTRHWQSREDGTRVSFTSQDFSTLANVQRCKLVKSYRSVHVWTPASGKFVSQRRAQQSHRIAILRFELDPKDRLESTHVRKKKAKHDSVGGIHLALVGSSSWNRGGKKSKKK